MERTNIKRIAELLNIEAPELERDIESYGTVNAIGGRIGSTLTVDAHMGIHQTGIVMRQIKTITVEANDWGFADLAESDATAPVQVALWIEWCARLAHAMGRIDELPYDERIEEEYGEQMLTDTEWEGIPDFYERKAAALEAYAN